MKLTYLLGTGFSSVSFLHENKKAILNSIITEKNRIFEILIFIKTKIRVLKYILFLILLIFIGVNQSFAQTNKRKHKLNTVKVEGKSKKTKQKKQKKDRSLKKEERKKRRENRKKKRLGNRSERKKKKGLGKQQKYSMDKPLPSRGKGGYVTQYEQTKKDTEKNARKKEKEAKRHKKQVRKELKVIDKAKEAGQYEQKPVYKQIRKGKRESKRYRKTGSRDTWFKRTFGKKNKRKRKKVKKDK